ncbi:MAG TPA: HD domain-containing phosphohydrolase [Vicinamibacterales bacterium]|nr:HD domain-containing phosphohydrolase [Vicinamibacterales bacterium]
MVTQPEPNFGTTERLTQLRAAAHILVIDDEELNLRLITQMLHHAGHRFVTTLTDARELEQRLEVTQPDLVILDLHMPQRDGYDVIRALQPWIVAEHLPILVVSGDLSSDARHRALSLGARDFLTKPFDLLEMTLRVRNQFETRLLYQDVRRQNRALIDAIHGRTRELEDTRIEMIERLAIAAEYRDDNTHRHTERVGNLASQLASAIGLGADEARLMRRAAALHDVGKIGIPDALLLKPSRLTEHEMDMMRTHTTIGAHILGGSQTPMLQLAETIAISHHERWDGTGYPRQLAGNDIPLPGRIVAVADAYDALTNDRPYRAARSLTEGLTELKLHRGTQFDAQVVDALLSFEPGTIGSGAFVGV